MFAVFQKKLVDSFFPRFCLGCQREGELWCQSCASTWWPVLSTSGCPFCGTGFQMSTCSSCQSDMFLDGLLAFAPYGNPIVRKAISQWKYIGDQQMESVLQQWLTRAAPSFFDRVKDGVFVPVPLHVRKRRARGFDQAGLMADWCGQIYSRPVFDLLVRRSFTSPQAMRANIQRQVGELDGIFRLHPAVVGLPKKVILCDDVFTSGATMDSAARVLKEAGVKEVWGLVLAKGK